MPWGLLTITHGTSLLERAPLSLVMGFISKAPVKLLSLQAPVELKCYWLKQFLQPLSLALRKRGHALRLLNPGKSNMQMLNVETSHFPWGKGCYSPLIL